MQFAFSLLLCQLSYLASGEARNLSVKYL